MENFAEKQVEVALGRQAVELAHAVTTGLVKLEHPDTTMIVPLASKMQDNSKSNSWAMVSCPLLDYGKGKIFDVSQFDVDCVLTRDV